MRGYGQEIRQSAHVVIVGVRDHDLPDACGIDSQFLHILQQDRAEGAGIEKEEFAVKLDQGGKSPAGRQARVRRDIIGQDGNRERTAGRGI